MAENLYLVENALPEALPYGLPWDLTYVLLYLFLALAAETRPHRRPGWSVDHPEYRFGLSGVVVFAFGMLCYFALIPGSVDVPSYDSYLPSYLLYIGLDIYLAIRFAIHLEQLATQGHLQPLGSLAVAQELDRLVELSGLSEQRDPRLLRRPVQFLSAASASSSVSSVSAC